jgi:hypothetical protein
MIPVKLHEGKLVDKSGNLIEPNENGLVEIEIEGKVKRLVFNKLVDYLERNGQVSKKPILRRMEPDKVKIRKIPKLRAKNGKDGCHRRKKVIITDINGIEQEFESVVRVHKELKVSLCQLFYVLSGKKETLKGYKIKYAI